MSAVAARSTFRLNANDKSRLALKLINVELFNALGPLTADVITLIRNQVREFEHSAEYPKDLMELASATGERPSLVKQFIAEIMYDSLRHIEEELEENFSLS